MENLNKLAHSVCLYGNSGLQDAFNVKVSDAADFFEGKAFADWVKGKEAEHKVQAAIGERLNSVIRACGVIVKAVSNLSGGFGRG